VEKADAGADGIAQDAASAARLCAEVSALAGGDQRDRAAEFHVRSTKGQELAERDCDARVLPRKRKELVARYGIRGGDDEVIA
jgi:hypothetical protein